MTLKLRNDWKFTGDDWWEWNAFLDDEGSGEITEVDYVEYVLHPTFKNPVRKIANPENSFRMKTAGWGIFNLKAFVYMKNGNKMKLDHMLELHKDPIDGMSR